MPKKKILFLVGSPNQTTQMHQVANELSDYDCFFSQVYTDNSMIKLAIKLGWLNTTVLAGELGKRRKHILKSIV